MMPLDPKEFESSVAQAFAFLRERGFVQSDAGDVGRPRSLYDQIEMLATQLAAHGDERNAHGYG